LTLIKNINETAILAARPNRKSMKMTTKKERKIYLVVISLLKKLLNLN
jgi:ATP-dependent Zn protease